MTRFYLTLFLIATLGVLVGPSLVIEFGWKYHNYVVACAARGDIPVENDFLRSQFGIQGIH